MSKKGISSVTLAITVVVLLILVTSISVSLTYSINNAKKMVFAKEIYNIQSIVTEYIEKENVLPAKESIQVEISGTTQIDLFDGENILDDKVVLNVLDLTELDIKNTTYGNGILGKTATEKSEDVYAVSQTTGRIYYIAGFEVNNEKYYTLTEELLNMIDKKQNLNIGESTILFMPDILGWTNQGVAVRVSVPNEYVIDSVTTDNTNIECTAETIDGVEYWSVNKAKVAQNYTVTVKYTKNGSSETISYTTKFDNVAPAISKDTSIANTDKSIRGLNATDNESGIKHFKYVEGVVENDYNAATYMNEFGKKIKNGSLKAKQRAIYTLYAEDKAGNYRLIHVDSEGERAYFTIENDIGTNEFILNNAYELSLLNYRIYGNSVQNGTPTVDAPVEIESVGDKTVNLLPYPYKTADTTINGITYKVNEDGSILLDGTAASATTFYVYQDKNNLIPGLEVGDTITISKTVDDDSQVSQVYFICNYYDESGTMQSGPFATTKSTATGTVSDAWKGIGAYIHIPNGNTVDNLVIKPMIQKGTVATEYEPYGKYKIPVIVSGWNLINPELFIKHGFEKLDDGSYFVQTSSTPRNQVIYENLSKKEGSITISYYTKFILSADNYVGAFPKILYTDGTYKSLGDLMEIAKKPTEYVKVTFTTPQDKIVDNISWSYFTGSASTYIKDMQIEFSEVATEYVPGTGNKVIIYLDEPLRKIGDYADYIDFKSGTLVRKVGETILNGTEEVTSTDIYGKKSFLMAIDYFKNALIEDETLNGFSTHFKAAKRSTVGDNTSSYYMATGSYVFNYNGVNTDIDGFKGFLAEQYAKDTACKVHYVLNKSAETSIDLPEIVTNAGYNRITIGTKIAPSETNIRYYNRVQ